MNNRSLRFMLPAPAVLFASLFLITSVLVPAIPPDALAGSSGGRVYDPKKLRPKADSPARGRTLKDKRQADPQPREPPRHRAMIPNPEPQRKGGSGYTRKGNYFYENAKPIRTYATKRGTVERVTIPHPNKKLR